MRLTGPNEQVRIANDGPTTNELHLVIRSLTNLRTLNVSLCGNTHPFMLSLYFFVSLRRRDSVPEIGATHLSCHRAGLHTYGDHNRSCGDEGVKRSAIQVR